MLIKNHQLFIAIVALCLIVSCGSEETEILGDDGLVHGGTLPPSDELQIVLIPTPVQAPSVLSLSNCEYNPEIIGKNFLTDHPTTSHQKAINLGISIVDFSYSAINKDHALSNKKLAICMELMGDLGIDIPKDEAFLERIENNKNDVDSMSFLILTAFERSTTYFKETDKEELGISILAGTALESSLLLAQELELDRGKEYFSFFNQQKQYATGLQVIMQRYKDLESMQKNFAIAENLEKAFSDFEVWAASGDTTIRFDTSKSNLLAEIFLIKENSLN
jgi:hypothetical protein